jgi:hypothetical protein
MPLDTPLPVPVTVIVPLPLHVSVPPAVNVWMRLTPTVVIVPPVQLSAAALAPDAINIGWNVPGMLACAADKIAIHGATTRARTELRNFMSVHVQSEGR